MKKEDFTKLIHLKRDKVYIILTMFFLLFSCNLNHSGQNYKYGVGFNNVRKKVGLIPLSDKWFSIENDNSNQIWYHNPDVDSLSIGMKAFYYAKVSLIRNDSIISESDKFIGKECYISSYGKVQEYLLYTYNFVPEDNSFKGWTYLIEQDPNKGKRGYISKIEADSILSLWGLSYPPAPPR